MNPDAQFEQLLTRKEQCLALAHAICNLHKLSFDCTRIEGGSRLMYATADGRIIKIFPPHEADFFETEVLFLKQLYGRLPIPTPKLFASGRCRGYPYIVMERLSGTPLAETWDELDDDERRRIVQQLGTAIRAMHDLPVSLFASAPFQWHPFIEHQRESLLTNHQNWGLDPAWLSQLTGYMDGFPLDLHDPARMVPLHTELMQEHVFIEKKGNEWVISGLIDFEPSMVGHREYEFCAVGLFITRGNRELFRLFLSSYGYSDAELTDDFGRRIMMLLLLHRYGNLRRFLTLIPPELHCTELRQLEQYWYSF